MIRRIGISVAFRFKSKKHVQTNTVAACCSYCRETVLGVQAVATQTERSEGTQEVGTQTEQNVRECELTNLTHETYRLRALLAFYLESLY